MLAYSAIRDVAYRGKSGKIERYSIRHSGESFENLTRVSYEAGSKISIDKQNPQHDQADSQRERAGRGEKEPIRAIANTVDLADRRVEGVGRPDVRDERVLRLVLVVKNVDRLAES